MLACGELQTFDEEAVEFVVRGEILNLVEFSGETFTPYQEKELVRIITTTYANMDVSEMKLCFERIKGGYYGKVYGRLTPMVVTEIFAKFWEEALHTRHQANIIKQNEREMKMLGDGTEKQRDFTVLVKSLEEKMEQDRKARQQHIKDLDERLERNKIEGRNRTLEHLFNTDRNEYDKYLQQLKDEGFEFENQSA